MNKKIDVLIRCYPQLEQALIDEINQNSSIQQFAKGEYIIRQGQFIKFLPIVLGGNVKIFCQEEDTQFLLYYIQAGEPCIYSFAHAFNGSPCEFSAISESKSELLMIPLTNVQTWIKQYPSFSMILLRNYQRHYEELLDSTKQIICYNLEERLIRYLEERANISQSNILALKHQTIADDLGSSREVITRLLKKLAKNGLLTQEGRSIKMNLK